MTDFLKNILNKRKEEGLLRTLSSFDGLEDFYSNDYLGLSKLKFETTHREGSTGSRLISGNSTYTEEVEKELATFYQQEAGLVFNSGYDSNLGLFSCIPQKGDTIIYDQLIHASVRDGIRLSLAKAYSFEHNSLEDLELKILRAKGNVFVAIESIYSMDGDTSPLKEVAKLCQKYNAHLIVDEAHSGGIYGKQGEGLVSELNLDNLVFAKLITFGKAYGSHGAIVLGSNDLRNFLINFARSFVYTTAIPPSAIERIKSAVDYSKDCEERAQLWNNIEAYKNYAEINGLTFNHSPIQTILCSSNEDALNKAEKLKEKGLAVKAILSPTVPKGQERIRICLHSFNNIEHLT